MNLPPPTVAGVIRNVFDEFLKKYGAKLSAQQRRALWELTACRSSALGRHALERCEYGHQQIAYNSCGNRHCPACRSTAAALWLEAQAADLLPVPHFELVFTLPNALDPLALLNRGLPTSSCYGRLPHPFSRWRPIPSVWVCAQACWPCCISGASKCVAQQPWSG
jgi:hypothetical protein